MGLMLLFALTRRDRLAHIIVAFSNRYLRQSVREILFPRRPQPEEAVNGDRAYRERVAAP
jgi:hypothetical protein